MTNKGITVYFFDERLRIFKEAMEFLKYPKYIHLLIDEKNKHLFIRRSETRDNDTFRVVTTQFGEERRYRISSKWFVKYLASLIGVEFPSNSLWFDGYFMEDENTVLIDLNKYHVIEYGEDT